MTTNNTRKLQEAIVRCYVSLNNYDILVIDKRKDHPSGLRFSDIRTLLSAVERKPIKPEVMKVEDFVDVFCRIGAHHQQDIYHNAKPIDMAKQVMKHMNKYKNGIIVK